MILLLLQLFTKYLFIAYLPCPPSQAPSFDTSNPSGFIDGIMCIRVLSKSHFI